MRAWEMSLRRYGGLLVTSGVIIAGGYGIMLLVTPTDEQLRKVLPQQQPAMLMAENDAGDAQTIRCKGWRETRTKGTAV